MAAGDHWREAIRAAEGGRPRDLVRLWEAEGRLPIGADEAVRALLWRLRSAPNDRGEVLLDALIEFRDRIERDGHRKAFASVLNNPRYGLKNERMLTNLSARPDVRRAMKARGIASFKFKIPKVTPGAA